jgi:hypothetical protein
MLHADPASYDQNDLSLNGSVTFKNKIDLVSLKKDVADLDLDAENIPLKTDLSGNRNHFRDKDAYFNEHPIPPTNQLTEANLQVIYHNHVKTEAETKLDQPNVIGNEHATFR